MLRPYFAILVAGIAMIVASGCGSSSGVSNNNAGEASVAKSSSGSTVTNETGGGTANGQEVVSVNQTELASKGNAICKHVHDQLTALSKSGSKDLPKIYTTAAGYEQSALLSLSKLTPPAQLADDWKVILTAMRTLEEDSTKYAQLAAGKKVREANDLVYVYGPIKHKGMEVAKQDGLEECARAL